MAILPNTSAFTIKGKGILPILQSPVEIYPHNEKELIKVNAIWDTGATNTVITKDVVNALGLKAAGKVTVNTASETNRVTDAFYIDIKLPNSVTVKMVRASLGVLTSGLNCLIGMDIITLGDFSVTNQYGKTCMSFRFPSQHMIDYVAEIEQDKKKS